MFNVIAAIAHDGAIGQCGALPWSMLQADRQWFARLTSCEDPAQEARRLLQYAGAGWPKRTYIDEASRQNAVIMGRHTWESLAQHPLPGRTNLVVTHGARDGRLGDDGECAWSPYEAIILAEDVYHAPQTWVIGGAQLYAEALQRQDCGALYLTEVEAKYPQADTYFPAMFLPEQTDTLPRVTKVQADGSLWHWYRTAVSAWIVEADRPRYRLGIYEREAS